MSPKLVETAWERWRRRAAKLRSHPQRARFLASRALWLAGVSSWFTVDLPDGLRVRFYPSSVSAALWVSPDARNDDAAFLDTVLRPGDTYLDCGANIGHLAIVARSIVGREGVVTAIEPNPRIFEYCVDNLRLNGFADVLALNTALGETRGAVCISDRRDDDQNRVGDAGTLVPLRPLDDIVGATPVTLLKLDVEGYELQVLKGAARTLAITSVVYCELSEPNSARFGYHPREVEDLLLSHGFVFARADGAAWNIVRHRLYETVEHMPRTGFNLVAVRVGALDDFAARLAARGQRII